MIRRSILAGLAIAGFVLPAAAQSTDPNFRINNRGAMAINEIYVSSSADPNWGQDLLGANVLPVGNAFLIQLPPGQCVNDIRIVWANGQPQERRQVNTCNLTDVAFP
jgi:hypothetical protein